MKYFCSVLLLLVLLPVTWVRGQDVYTFHESSTIEVVGTSNKSDFAVKAEEYSGSVSLTDGAPTAATLQIVVAAMKSGRSMIMDRLMRSSLNADEHPTISFEMTGATSSKPETFVIDGNLTLSGVTKPVSLTLVKSQASDGKTVFAGSTILDMREYEIDPPTAMFGSLITKPEVTLKFYLVLTK